MTTPGCISTFQQAQYMPAFGDGFFTQRELLNTMLFVSVKCRREGGTKVLPGLGKVCVFTQEELVLYILAHTQRYKQNVHLLMKDQPAWKRRGLERKCVFRERQEQILQHTELLLVNNIGYRSKLPFSVSESQVSQASSLLGNIFRVGCSQIRWVSLGRNPTPRHHTELPPASVA